ncbi:MAG: pitrilysin family protein, partial [Parvularculaceae bacterium]
MVEVIALRNGVRLIVDPMPSLESAAIGVWANAGAIDEAPEENGVAHLLEHMAFKGTRRRTARDIAEAIESVGGYLNAATSYQRTGYYARILKNDVPLAVDLLTDILTEPLLDAAELEKEKEVVIQEIGEAADAPDDAVGELLQTKLFTGQSLGRPILGTVETVRSHDPARLRAFMERLYGRANLVVAAAGAIDPDAIARDVEARLAGLPAGDANPRPASARYVGGAAHDDRDIEQCHVAAAFPGVGTEHKDYFAMSVFAEALGGGMASRLFQSIREERGLAYSVYAAAESYAGTGALAAYIGTDGEDALEAVQLLRGEIESAARGMRDDELSRARAMLKSMRLMSLESPASRIELAAGQLFTFGEILTPEFVCGRLDALTLADLK